MSVTAAPTAPTAGRDALAGTRAWQCLVRAVQQQQGNRDAGIRYLHPSGAGQVEGLATLGFGVGFGKGLHVCNRLDRAGNATRTGSTGMSPHQELFCLFLTPAPPTVGLRPSHTAKITCQGGRGHERGVGVAELPCTHATCRHGECCGLAGGMHVLGTQTGKNKWPSLNCCSKRAACAQPGSRRDARLSCTVLVAANLGKTCARWPIK